MKHELYDIWEEALPPTARYSELRWHAQMYGFEAYFKSRKAAEEYVASVKKERERLARS